MRTSSRNVLDAYHEAARNRYSEPTKFSIVEVPLPELRDDDVLVKVKACGVCGTGKTELPLALGSEPLTRLP